jgi:hypothetical protein
MHFIDNEDEDQWFKKSETVTKRSFLMKFHCIALNCKIIKVINLIDWTKTCVWSCIENVSHLVTELHKMCDGLP